jgi:hypothetical protein
MHARSFEVTYHAEPQFERLSKAEKAELERLVTDPHRPGRELPASGKFVSRLGASKRVVWTLSDQGRPRILSVVEGDAA